MFQSEEDKFTRRQCRIRERILQSQLDQIQPRLHFSRKARRKIPCGWRRECISKKHTAQFNKDNNVKSTCAFFTRSSPETYNVYATYNDTRWMKNGTRDGCIIFNRVSQYFYDFLSSYLFIKFISIFLRLWYINPTCATRNDAVKNARYEELYEKDTCILLQFLFFN